MNNWSEEKPEMIEIYSEHAWQHAFCYACAVEDGDYEWQSSRLLFALIAGNDSTIQAISAAINTGTNGLRFGYGIKELTGYRFEGQFSMFSDKGKYKKFPLSIDKNRKGLILVHEKLLNGVKYFISFDDPAEDLRKILGGPPFGLHILPEWKQTIYNEFLSRGIIEKLEFYHDTQLLPQFHIFKINLNEDEEVAELEMDEIISNFIKEGKLPFPQKGDGSALTNIKDLTSYMETFVDEMITKVSKTKKPIHDPMVDDIHPRIREYKRELFPVQAHVATALAKVLHKQKSVLLQGEMSTGKSSMMVATGDIWASKKGYFACIICPPSLTKKWVNEVKELLPDADVRSIERTEDLIRYHSHWMRQGKPKPQKPTFFIISFTTMRSDSAIVPAVRFEKKRTTKQLEREEKPYRYGYYCPDCGQPLQVIEEKKIEFNENGEEVESIVSRVMEKDEFGKTRRIHHSKKPANAFCTHCGASLWTKTVPHRYSSFQNWARFETKIIRAIQDNNRELARQIVLTQPDVPKKVGQPRRIAAGEYMRRRMRRFFDFSIIDEIHQLKGGMTAQGISTASLVTASKKIIGGTGTLFGGKAEDIFYILWRLFPGLMKKNGYRYSELRKWNEEYGNIETTIYSSSNDEEFSNKQSRGGVRKSEKVIPGISPYVFNKFLIQNTANVRLKDVWPNPVELVDVPTILIDLDPELQKQYQEMERLFQQAIQNRDDGHKLYLPFIQTAVAYPDNPFTYPGYALKTEDGKRELIWDPEPFPKERLLNKEKKLQEIIQKEIQEGRKSIVYVRDTGSSVAGRDVRPRLKWVLEQIGAKVIILDTSTTATNKRSEWLEKKMLLEGYDVCIVSQELVQVGLDLIHTPTLIFYQFSWSLFVHNQASRRAWRIGQTKECRNFYLAYRGTYQEYMATLIAQKNKAASILNGDVSSEGINAMLGSEEDIQTLLIKSIKEGRVLKGSTEEWVRASSDRAKEILANIEKKEPSQKEQFISWVNQFIKQDSAKNQLIRKAEIITKLIKDGKVPGFAFNQNSLSLEVDSIAAFGFDISYISEGEIVAYFKEHLTKHLAASKKSEVEIVEVEVKSKRKKRNEPIYGQLAFKLF